MKNLHNNYSSVFSWRYGTPEMREVFSEENKYKIWRRIWVTIAEAQNKAGLVKDSELIDLRAHQDEIDIERILEIEKETKHDLVAAIKEFAEKAKVGGGKIHLGATSMDIVDNTDLIKIKLALDLVEEKVKLILEELVLKIEQYSDFPCLGYTHLQAAEPTTLGYRFAFYAQDLLTDLKLLKFVRENLKAKGFKGAVGTSSAFVELLEDKKMDAASMENIIVGKLGLDPALITSQVYSRKTDYLILTLLSSICASLSKFALDLRVMQSPGFGEWSESFEEKQVGSSAMPFKKNPLNAEKICSLTRFVSKMPDIALENSSNSILERTLDDSANKRITMAESFLATDEILKVGLKILKGLIINEERIKYNLQQFTPFAATEQIILEAVKKGANRQEIHEEIRKIALKAWDRIQKGRSNPMKILLAQNKVLLKYLKTNQIINCIKNSNHMGDAPERALKLAKLIKERIRG